MSVENYNGYTLPTIEKWSGLSRFFHWGSVLLLIITWVMIVQYEKSDSTQYIMLHKAFGVSVLFFVIARIINRFFSKAPALPPMPIWQIAISHLTHLALYLCLLAMPIAGVLMSVYGGRPVSFFGLFNIPVFVEVNRTTARFYNDLHTDLLWPALLILTALHVGAALFHQFVQKDNLLLRMK